jgi:hypothetical protein
MRTVWVMQLMMMQRHLSKPLYLQQGGGFSGPASTEAAAEVTKAAVRKAAKVTKVGTAAVQKAAVQPTAAKTAITMVAAAAMATMTVILVMWRTLTQVGLTMATATAGARMRAMRRLAVAVLCLLGMTNP